MSLGKCFSLGRHVGLLFVFVSDSAKKIAGEGGGVVNGQTGKRRGYPPRKECCQGQQRPLRRVGKEAPKAVQQPFSKLCKKTEGLASRKAEVSPSRKRLQTGSTHAPGVRGLLRSIEEVVGLSDYCWLLRLGGGL